MVTVNSKCDNENSAITISPDALKHANELWVTDVRKKKLSQKRESFWFGGFCFFNSVEPTK